MQTINGYSTVILEMNTQKVLGPIDSFQQRHKFLAFPIAVIKRYGDEKVGYQAALITYYAFLSLFPLLMIFITVLAIVAEANPELRNQIQQTVFQAFPALGKDLDDNVDMLQGSGLALGLQFLVVVYGARGLANILQESFNNLWHIEKEQRPGFLGDNLRSFGMMLAVGLGMIIGSAISYGLSGIIDIGTLGVLLINIVNILITFVLFLAVFRLGTSNTIGLGTLVMGAAIAAIGVLLVQRFGGIIMSEQLQRLEGLYGSFAATLGLLFWIYLQAQIIMYAIVATVVRTRNDWPKKLF